MVMTHVKGRKYQQGDIKCAGSQHLYRGQEKNKDERSSTVRSGEKVRGRCLEGLQESGKVQSSLSFEALNVFKYEEKSKIGFHKLWYILNGVSKLMLLTWKNID